MSNVLCLLEALVNQESHSVSSKKENHSTRLIVDSLFSDSITEQTGQLSICPPMCHFGFGTELCGWLDPVIEDIGVHMYTR